MKQHFLLILMNTEFVFNIYYNKYFGMGCDVAWRVLNSEDEYGSVMTAKDERIDFDV